jgi:hypothetical protein
VVRIALVGCSKTKMNLSAGRHVEARDLYVSELFKLRRSHVEGRMLPWYILSAKSGLLNPATLVRTYDQPLANLEGVALAEWHIDVANTLMTELVYTFGSSKLSTVTVEFHAGSRYCEPLASVLKLFGIKVERPVAGLGIGQQLAHYRIANESNGVGLGTFAVGDEFFGANDGQR